MRKIDKIIIHCSATKEGFDYSVNDVKSWHLQRGWSDVGYHYIIRIDGTIQKGRDVSKIGAHCKGHNEKSIGVCYIGGLNYTGISEDTRTPLQKHALKELIKELKELYPNASVHGHNEFSPKACPCFDVSNEFN